jgi:hypothetical protein
MLKGEREGRLVVIRWERAENWVPQAGRVISISSGMLKAPAIMMLFRVAALGVWNAVWMDL